MSNYFVLVLQYGFGVNPQSTLFVCLFRSWYWYDTNYLVLMLQYCSGMDPLLSYYYVYLGLGIGMILMMLCWSFNIVWGWNFYYLFIQKVSEYDQETPQSLTTYQPTEP